MNFEVNGETYSVTLGENEGQWLVYVSTPDGPRPVSVYEDASEFGDFNLVLEDKKRRHLVN